MQLSYTYATEPLKQFQNPGSSQQHHQYAQVTQSTWLQDPEVAFVPEAYHCLPVLAPMVDGLVYDQLLSEELSTPTIELTKLSVKGCAWTESSHAELV